LIEYVTTVNQAEDENASGKSTTVSSSFDLTTSKHEGSPEWLLDQESNGGIRILQANENSIHLGMKLSECLSYAEYYENVWSDETAIKDFDGLQLADVHDFLNNSEYSIIKFVCDGLPKRGTSAVVSAAKPKVTNQINGSHTSKNGR